MALLCALRVALDETREGDNQQKCAQEAARQDENCHPRVILALNAARAIAAGSERVDAFRAESVARERRQAFASTYDSELAADDELANVGLVYAGKGIPGVLGEDSSPAEHMIEQSVDRHFET